MLICILTKNVITSCSVTMMLFLHLEVKPLMTLTTVLYLSCALISGHLAMMLMALKWLETNNLFNNLIQRNQSAAFSSGKVRPNHETNINIIARRTGKDVNSHTVLDGIITTIMATIQRINI